MIEGIKFILTVVLLLLFNFANFAGDIVYDSKNSCIHVTGFPEDKPATLDTVLKADRENNWNLISYDKKTQTYILNASLWIGDNRETGTYFQIGDETKPAITLIMRGDLWLCPPKKGGIRKTDRRYFFENRLTVGQADNLQIEPKIKFACTKPNEFGLLVGLKTKPGGSLFLYNTTVTSLTPDKEHVWRGFAYVKSRSPGGLWAHELKIVNSTFTWIGGELIFYCLSISQCDLQTTNCVIDGLIVEHCGSLRFFGPFLSRYKIKDKLPVSFSPFLIKNSLFCDVGSIYLATPGTFVNCQFENNDYNINFNSTHNTQGVTFIDCRLEPQHKPLLLPKRRSVTNKSKIHPPRYIDELAILDCLVTDEEGKPVSEAFVEIVCPKDKSAVHQAFSVTGQNGRTPAELDKKAIIYTVQKLTSTENPEQPKKSQYIYKVKVNAIGFKPKSLIIDSKKSVTKPLKITLQKKD